MVKDVFNDWQQLSYSFTVTEDFLNVTSMRIESNYYESSNYTTTIANVIFACPQLELNDKTTDFEKYVDPVTTTISLANHEPLRSVGTAYDYIDYENNRIVRNIRHVSRKVSNMNNSENYPGWTSDASISVDYPKGSTTNFGPYISNISPLSKGFAINTDYAILFLSTAHFGLKQSEWKEKYNDLIIDLYYKMPTPIYEPLNLPRTLINSSSGHVVAYDESMSSSSVTANFVNK